MIYQGDNLSVRALENGIVELTLDSQGSVNKLDLSTLESLDQALDALAGRDDVKGSCSLRQSRPLLSAPISPSFSVCSPSPTKSFLIGSREPTQSSIV